VGMRVVSQPFSFIMSWLTLVIAVDSGDFSLST
jgi:hypothetical protein